MARRCDRCRAEYESGADYGGHDYCMTCYTMVRREDERKREEAEKLRQQKIEYRKEQMREDIRRAEKARGRQGREAAAESARQEAASDRKRRDAQPEEIRKRQKLPETVCHYAVESSAPPQIFTPLLKRKKPLHAPEQHRPEEPVSLSLRPATVPKKERRMGRGVLPDQQPLSLSIASGLPVSLSVGQRSVQVLLIGKNASASPIAVVAEVSILDSQKAAVASKAEPRTCAIEPGGESRINVAFDLPEDVARGMLSFTALLKENAVYIDRPSAQSNAVSLSSQVKSPMELQYRRGSVAFKEGALLLTFDNVGESGGILEKSSSVTCFSQESIGKKAALTARAKVKGGEKGVTLSFAPADEAPISRLELDLAGTDSNGKPYSLKRKISKKGAPEGEGKI